MSFNYWWNENTKLYIINNKSCRLCVAIILLCESVIITMVIKPTFERHINFCTTSSSYKENEFVHLTFYILLYGSLLNQISVPLCIFRGGPLWNFPSFFLPTVEKTFKRDPNMNFKNCNKGLQFLNNNNSVKKPR